MNNSERERERKREEGEEREREEEVREDAKCITSLMNGTSMGIGFGENSREFRFTPIKSFSIIFLFISFF